MMKKWNTAVDKQSAVQPEPTKPTSFNVLTAGTFNDLYKASQRRNIVLKLMENAEFIKPEEREKAAKTSVASSLVPEKKRVRTLRHTG